MEEHYPGDEGSDEMAWGSQISATEELRSWAFRFFFPKAVLPPPNRSRLSQMTRLQASGVRAVAGTLKRSVVPQTRWRCASLGFERDTGKHLSEVSRQGSSLTRAHEPGRPMDSRTVQPPERLRPTGWTMHRCLLGAFPCCVARSCFARCPRP